MLLLLGDYWGTMMASNSLNTVLQTNISPTSTLLKTKYNTTYPQKNRPALLRSIRWFSQLIPVRSWGSHVVIRSYPGGVDFGLLRVPRCRCSSPYGTIGNVSHLAGAQHKLKGDLGDLNLAGDFTSTGPLLGGFGISFLMFTPIFRENDPISVIFCQMGWNYLGGLTNYLFQQNECKYLKSTRVVSL